MMNEEKFTVYGEDAEFISSNGDTYGVSLLYTVQSNTVDLIVGNSSYWALSVISFLESEVPSFFNMQVGVNNSSAPHALNFDCRK